MRQAQALDNPIWHALTGPQAALAQVYGPLRRYPPDVAPFYGFQERDDRALRLALEHPDLAARPVVLFRPVPEPPPAPWRLTFGGEIVQMVCGNARHLGPTGDPVLTLGEADVPEMLALVARTKPGPFGARTVTLGAYFGVRYGGRLVALAGERLRPGGYVEVSAVCTDPAWRGRGLAARLVGHLVRRALEAGQTPFLHVMETNAAAMHVYAALGFEVRTHLHLSVWAPPTRPAGERQED